MKALRDRGRGHERPAAARPLPGPSPDRGGAAARRARRRSPTSWGPSARAATSWPAAARCPPLEPGDLLAVRDAGAYGFVMASNYNMRPRAAEALIENGAVRLIRRRETFDDLVRTEV